MSIGVSFALVLIAGTAVAKPYYPGDFTTKKKLDALQKRVGAKEVPFVRKEAIARTKKALGAGKRVRILHLGDSHVASDFITSMARYTLQQEYGGGGGGFSHIDRKWGYGGRRLKRKESTWLKDRIVDANRAGRPFGFSGVSLTSKKKGAKVSYKLLAEDRKVRLYYQAHAKGPTVQILVDGKPVGRVDTKAGAVVSRVFDQDIGESKKKRTLTLVAGGKGARLFGLSFENKRPGLLYDVIGPVGADAKVYLQLDRDSFVEHLKAHDPQLVVLMVGGNDALKIRKGWTSLAKVKKDHEGVLGILKQTLPGAECMIWTPMDAGKKKGKRVTSLALIPEVRAMQLELAEAHGCAVWDLHAVMGGTGSIAKWSKARVMNKDLVHPRKSAADLLGRIFAKTWLLEE